MNFNDNNHSELKTILHEIGHWYGVKDHYGGDVDSTDSIDPDKNLGYSKDCIYGENKENENVAGNLILCDGCKNIIQKNLNGYNH